MENLKVFTKLMAMIGYSRYPTEQREKINRAIVTFNFLILFYHLLAIVNQTLISTDILEIAENFSHISTISIVFVKLIILTIYADDLFDALDEAGSLNEKCKDLERQK